jgi:pimeloyl-ACP methyl ester carboxylesterase
MVILTFCRLFPEHLGTLVKGLALVGTSHTNPACTTTAAGFVRSVQKPVLVPLLHLLAWFAPLVWLMSWINYLNGSSHLLAMVFGFAGSQTRGQLDLAARYNPLAWPGVVARETLAMFRYDATDVLGSISIPTLVFTGDLDRLVVPETAHFMASRMSNSQVVRLAPAGHMAVFESHEQLTSALRTQADAVFDVAQPAQVNRSPRTAPSL